MNLIFYPNNIDFDYLVDAVNMTIDKLTKFKQPYKLFNYNDKNVIEQKRITMDDHKGKNLIIPLEFIKNYCNQLKIIDFYIYIFTDGYSDEFTDIYIPDYMPENIINLFYIQIPNNKYENKELDFYDDWLDDIRFKYVKY